MAINVDCPGCGKELAVPENVRGKKIRCTNCETIFVVPMPKSPSRTRSEAADDDDDAPKRKPGTSKTSVRARLDELSASSSNRRKKQRDDDDDFDDEEVEVGSRRSARDRENPMMAQLMIGGGAAVILIVGVVIFFLTGSKSKPQDPAFAQNNPNFPQPNFPQPNFPQPNFPQPNFPQPNIPEPNFPAIPERKIPEMPQPEMNPADVLNGFPPDVRDQMLKDMPPELRKNFENQLKNGKNTPPAPRPNRPNNPLLPPDPFGGNAKENIDLTDWVVTADPTTTKVDLPEKMPSIAAPIPSSGNVLFPGSPSPFFVTGTLRTFGNSPTSIGVWDIRTGKLAGRLDGKLELDEPAAISPDGKMIAAKAGGFTGKFVDVYDFKAKKGIRRIEFDGNWGPEWVEFANDNKAVATVHNGKEGRVLDVWSIETGDLLHSINLKEINFTKEHAAMSPGHRYVATADDKRLIILDLKEGKVAGVKPFPLIGEQGFGNRMECQGIAWSEDGKEITVALGNRFAREGGWHLAVWDVVKGDELTTVDISDTELKNFFQNYKGPGVEYLPKGNGWLLNGQYVVDRESGAIVEKLFFAPNDHNPAQRRLLANGVILTAEGDHSARRMMGRQLDMKKIDTATAAAKAGQKELGDAKPGDLAGAKSMPAKAGAWTLNLREPKLARAFSGVPLKSKAAEIIGLYFARPERAQAVCISVGELQQPYIHKAIRVDRFDLSSRKLLNSFEIPGPAKSIKLPFQAVADFSDEGSVVAFRHPQTLSRVDLFTSADGKHLLGLTPYAADRSDVEWVGLIGDKQLLTLGTNGKLISWDTTTAKATFQCGGNYQQPLIFSPSKKCLAAYNSHGIDFIDTATGEIKGAVELPAGNFVPVPNSFPGQNANRQVVGAFDLEGARFAAVVPTTEKQIVALFDLRDGSKTKQFETDATDTTYLQWTSSGFLLQNGRSVIDPHHECIVWNYDNPWKYPLARTSPDGRQWVAVGVNAGPNQEQVTFSGMELPDAQLAANLNASHQPDVEKLLGKGAVISVQVNAPGPAKAGANYAGEIAQAMSQALRARGYEVQANAAMKMVVQASESPTGETATIYEVTDRSPFGGPRFFRPPIPFGGPLGNRPPDGKAVATISLPKVDSSVRITDAAGQVVYENKQVLKYGDTFTRDFKNGEDYATALSGDVWGFFRGHVTNLRIPTLVLRQRGTILNLPGQSALPSR
ncbi:hypothetical protein [Tuwongella immobilis]|uniref:Wd-40 repeat-containing protein: Uncharacterized protein n=1 Tax=Tuwongella immobilis TaxID=692036 RepID=A0A6C2YXP6_9BACT|nr:hypothetical protein [Tuwongella immobilis]VIP05639.1 wd-40 repeat-containing protein : Uncharacterized protein OS=Blastopirellula marina DSM 3645 GN=DSM3645_10007 PE=4 SV=1 [Tuwongella immobilis]VTS08634.1 wd-40 repeat-containing protein : Uncharacterized protein OS=Blastopirellula marina DSM 3645 GN=DSM3645_10007 PE=4 SV=1 [Tuwongella immobilis]